MAKDKRTKEKPPVLILHPNPLLSIATDLPLGARDNGALVLEVEDDAALACIQLPEIGAGALPDRHPRAHHVTFRRLDLDDVRTEVGEQPRAMGAGDGRREIENTEAAECRCHLPSKDRCPMPS